jgi:hypothetical protein
MTGPTLTMQALNRTTLARRLLLPRAVRPAAPHDAAPHDAAPHDAASREAASCEAASTASPEPTPRAPRDATVVRAVERIAGLQSQDSRAAAIGLWTRVHPRGALHGGHRADELAGR